VTASQHAAQRSQLRSSLRVSALNKVSKHRPMTDGLQYVNKVGIRESQAHLKQSYSRASRLGVVLS
jgi:hypothetical protein